MKLRSGIVTPSTAKVSDLAITFSSKVTVALHEGQFTQPHDAPLVEGAVAVSLHHVAAVFRGNGHSGLKQDGERNIAQLQWLQLILYKKDNPKEVQQKALPVCVLRFILPSKSKNYIKQLANLQEMLTSGQCNCARMQKYLKSEQRQMEQLCLRNISFIKEGKILIHSLNSLFLAD
jgi:hypothetical protein